MQREKNNNFILDFTGVYDDEFAKEKTSLTWIDCTDITGCDMYVSDEAEKQIGERVDSVGIHGIHFLDSGNRSEERRVGKECRSRWSPYH